MDRPTSIFAFKMMTFGFRVRDLLRPRIEILREVGIEPGAGVLDYGCGPGSYIPPLAELIGPTGMIYALDMEPAAIKAAERIATRKKIENIRMILSDCSTGLEDESVDIVLLYDTFHHLSQPRDVLGELRRVLRPRGILSVSDHHMLEQDIVAGVTSSGMFALSKRGKRTYSFAKVER